MRSLIERPTGLHGRFTRLRLSLALVVFAVSLAGCTGIVRPNYTTERATLRGGNYSLDPEHAYLLFRVEHLGLSTVVGRFDVVDATLDFDPADITSLLLDGAVEMSSVNLNNESLERRLQGSDWFDVARFPEARFTTTAVTAEDGNAFGVEGDFTLRGVTLPLKLDARFVGGADNLLTGRYTVGFEATGTLSRSDYGIDGLGALVGDTIGIEIHGEFQRLP